MSATCPAHLMLHDYCVTTGLDDRAGLTARATVYLCMWPAASSVGCRTASERLPNAVVKRLTLLLRIEEVPGSNFCPGTGYPNSGFRVFSQYLQVNAWVVPKNEATTASFQIHSNSLHTYYPFIRRCIV
jgi:hypothetical protein